MTNETISLIQDVIDAQHCLNGQLITEVALREPTNSGQSIPIQALWDALDFPVDEVPTAARVWEVLMPILEAEANDRMSEPESIPVAELAEVLGCDVDAVSVRMR